MRTSRSLVALALALPLVASCDSTMPGEELHDLFAREWQFRLEENPLLATAVDVHTWDDELPSDTPADLQRRYERTQAFLKELDAIPLDELSQEDRINAAIFRRQLRNRVADYEFGDYQIPFNADSGFQTGFSRLPFEVPLQTTEDYENYLARLRDWPRWVGEEIELMRQGLERGMTQPRLILDGIDGTMTAHIVDDPEQSVFWTPFQEFPVGAPEADRERLRDEGRRDPRRRGPRLSHPARLLPG
ncbi:MAG: DUF885 family protein [Thermoanaerobaculia bacterium]